MEGDTDTEPEETEEDETADVTVTPNKPPVITGSIPDQQINLKGGLITIDLSNYFTDDDDDKLIYNLAVEDVTVSYAGESVTVSMDNLAGSWTIEDSLLTIDSSKIILVWDSAVESGLVSREALEEVKSNRARIEYTVIVTATDGRGEEEARLPFKLISAAQQPPVTKTLDEVVLPDVVQQITAHSIEAITSRLDNIASGVQGSMTGISMDTVLSDTVTFLSNHQEALNNGEMQWEQALSGRSFAFPLSSVDLAEGHASMPGGRLLSSLGIWGGVDYSAYGNKVGGVDIDGGGFSGTVGVDVQPTPRLVTGLALATSRWGLDYTTRDTNDKGAYTVGVTMVSPYMNWIATDQLSFWGAFSYGRGEVKDDQKDWGSSTTKQDSLTSWAGGVRWQILSDADSLTEEGFPFGLAVKADGATSEFLDTNVRMARLAAEVSRSFSFESGLLNTALEFGWSIRGADNNDNLDPLLQRIADKNEGGGTELALSVNWLNADARFSATADGRLLLGGGDRKEWGIGGNLRFMPDRDGEGLSLTVEPSIGNPTGTRLVDLWLTDHGDIATGKDMPGARLSTELGYGFRLDSLALLTPYTRLDTTDHSTTYGAGIRYQLDNSLDLDLSASRWNSASGNNDNRLFLQLRSDL